MTSMQAVPVRRRETIAGSVRWPARAALPSPDPKEKKMASSHDNASMAVFCDFENVALGVRDAKYEKFDIKRVLERLLLKGNIVVKKAYCDWDRYKGFKSAMHEANFELIEIPHVRQSGKNSADIRLVVDALDLCYTKQHVDTFVIISGDSDFSPLVSKLRENARKVIGVGVKQSTSDLLIANCDEFIFYDDLVRDQRAAKRDTPEARDAQPARRSPEEDKRRKDELEARRSKAIEIAVETFEALLAERGDGGKIWASMLKEAIKRRKPDFNESYFGFRAFGNLLEEAQSRGLLEFGRDEKSGTYVYRRAGAAPVLQAAPMPHPLPENKGEAEQDPVAWDAGVSEAPPAPERERGGRRNRGRHRNEGAGRKPKDAGGAASEAAAETQAPVIVVVETPVAPAVPAVEKAAGAKPARSASRRRKPEAAAKAEAAEVKAAPAPTPAPAAEAAVAAPKGRGRRAPAKASAEAQAKPAPAPAEAAPAAAQPEGGKAQKPKGRAKPATESAAAEAKPRTPSRSRRPRKQEAGGEG